MSRIEGGQVIWEPRDTESIDDLMHGDLPDAERWPDYELLTTITTVSGAQAGLYVHRGGFMRASCGCVVLGSERTSHSQWHDDLVVDYGEGI
jgi:hypothetical protein